MNYTPPAVSLLKEPVPFEGEYLPHFREDTLVVQADTVGFLQDLNKNKQLLPLCLLRFLLWKDKKPLPISLCVMLILTCTIKRLPPYTP
ncbi:hypothetical protein [Capnocytophaga granulosa]|nr:hypothetical protein [Capnocytophaga granulosa]